MTTPEKLAERGRILLWTAGVTLLLLAPMPGVLEGESLHRFGRLHGDKLVHLALFFGLARVWLGGRGDRRAAPALAIALAAALYGGLLELVQGAAGRDPEWGDFAADLAGALLAWAAWRRSPRARRPPLPGTAL